MRKNYLNTNAVTACEMIEVSDKDILEWSNGEVTSPDVFNEDESLDTSDGSLFSKKIFGSPLEETMKMGHIVLPLPVVNPQYVRGKKPVLPNLLGMSRKDVEDIIRYCAYYNTNTKAVIPADSITTDNKDFCFTGGTGIEKIMMDKGVSTEYIILHNLPVIPAALRITKVNCPMHSDAIQINCVNSLYSRVMYRIRRLEMLETMGAPEIIVINEKRMLEDTVAALIGNGLYSVPFTSPDGICYFSLDDVAENIKRVFFRNNIEETIKQSLESCTVVPDDLWKKLKKSCEMTHQFSLDYEQMCKERNTTGLSQEEYNKLPITVAFKKKHDPLEESIYSDIYEIISSVFDKMFSGYSEYKEQFVISAENAIDRYIDDIHEHMTEFLEESSAEEFFDQIAHVAYDNMENMKKKRVQWIKYDTYALRRLED